MPPLDVETAACCACGRRAHRSEGQPERQAIRPQRTGGGEITLAFGLDLSPLAARAEEFERMAEEIEAEARAVRLAKERDLPFADAHIAKMIARQESERHPDPQGWAGTGSWQEIHAAFRGLVEGISRNASLDELEVAAEVFLCHRSRLTSSTYWKII